MPRTKKAAGTAVDPRNGRRIELQAIALARFDLPDRDGGWSEEVLMGWEGLWGGPIAGTLTEVDRVVLLRWADYLERAIRAVRRADENPVAKGSMGQPVENPEYGIAARALAVVEKCEQQLGVGALNRSRLGISLTSERASIAALNQRLSAVPDDEDEEDPRVIPGSVVDNG